VRAKPAHGLSVPDPIGPTGRQAARPRPSPEGALDPQPAGDVTCPAGGRGWELAHEHDYSNAAAHFDRRLAELAAAGALRVDEDGYVVIVSERVPAPETPATPAEIVGVSF
jgi:hypothetical protein